MTASLAERGLLLDLDGTLADSVRALKQVYFSFLAQFSAVGDEAEFERLNGPPLAQIVAELKLLYGLPGDSDDLLKNYLALVQQAHRVAQPAAGARKLILHARSAGWKIAVVTSSPRLSASRWLTAAGLFNDIDVVVGGDEVVSGKPAAEPYVLGLARLQCSAAVSHAVEDSRIGARSALAAGLNTWAISSPGERHSWPVGVVFIDRLIDLLERLPWR
ncbi:HAD family hydrolase [Bradyrhizobium ottawaense]|uniref:HAD family hydrolase n=1 Tax=Bradyrhizobium ottawaense TaxID=931866 RepID=UPI0027D4AEA3|nr:HAD-IA family hydrolase [Bradyrhizobium ottawaense]GMO70978.1 HAD-IA family hydrolase [Bradyrhizobium ottawaense]